MTRILVVEDSPTQAEHLRFDLETAGYEAEVAANAEDALDHLAASAFDMVISDIVMPGLSGYDLCRRVKAEEDWRAIPVILLTTLNDPMDIIQALECGADSFFTKPYQVEHLLKRIEGIFDNRQIRSAGRLRMGVEVAFLGKRFTITSDREQILDLLISTFEDIVRTNQDLETSRNQLAEANARIEDYARRMEGEARVSEQKYRQLFDIAKDAILLVDLESEEIVDANQAAKTLSGLSDDEIIGAPWSQLFPTDKRFEEPQQFREWAEAGVGAIEGVMTSAPDGTAVPVEINAGNFQLDGKRFLLAIVRDITKRKQDEQALRESEQRIRAVMENVADGVVTIWEDGTIESFNRAAEDLFGYRAEEVIGHRVDILMPEPQRSEHDGYLGAYLRTGEAKIIGQGPRELTARRKDGSSFPMEISVSETFLGDKRMFIGAMRDITERKRYEERLAANMAQLQTILDNVDEGIGLVDADLTVLLFNDKARELLDFPADLALPGRRLSDYFRYNAERGEYGPGDPQEQVRERIELAERAEPHVFERTRPDGTVLEVRRNPVPGGGFVSTYVDISERKAMEMQLRQAQKMEAVGQLTGGIAHDFNNLLTVVLGNLQLLERSLKGDERLEKRLASATDATLRGAELTKRLLAFSRRQVLEPQVVELNELVSGMDDLLRRTLGETISIRTVLGDDLARTRVDPGQLENALLNLAVNARDAMPEGGALTIETANATLDEVYAARHAEVTAGDYVMLAVSDTGSGMDEKTIERVFEPFFTTKETGKGTGLGLSMVYGFVKQSGGHAKIYSEIGHGTAVKIYLPISDRTDTSAWAPQSDELPTGSEAVLVVEDDEPVRETAVAILESLGYRVLEAGDAAAALGALDEHDDVDLVFTDVVMPGGMKGPELAHRVREEHPRVKVLLTSGYTENSIAHGGIVEAGVHIIGKPYTDGDLARMIRRVLDG